jgi:hypothetical protein
MTDEFTLRKDMARAVQAQALIDNELFIESFDALLAEYRKAWEEDTAARDSDARERLWLAIQVLKKVRTHLTGIVAGGTFAQRELNELERAGRRSA